MSALALTILFGVAALCLGAWAVWASRRVAALEHERDGLHLLVHQLREQAERAGRSQSFAQVGTWDWRIDTDELHWSDEVYRLFGYAPGAVTPSYSLFCSHVHPDDSRRVREGELTCIETDASHDEEYRVVWRDGTVRWLRETGNVVTDADGRPVRMMGMVRDITEEKRAEQHLLHIAYHDPLTGLPNRLHFQTHLPDALARSRRHDRLLALAYVDLDGFKPINDRHGHAVGDAVLTVVAERLRASVRATDFVARLGGDEFAVLLEDLDQVDQAHLVLGKLLKAVQEPVEADGLTLTVGASIGVSIHPLLARDAESLLETADQAMFTAKRQGRGRVELYSGTS